MCQAASGYLPRPRSGHGSTIFKGRGFAIDVTFDHAPLDERGFYDPQLVIRFLYAVEDLIKLLRKEHPDQTCEWHALYDDIEVARPVNRKLGVQKVGFMGMIETGADGEAGLNWHGPDRLKLHIHLDLMLPAKTPLKLPPKPEMGEDARNKGDG